MYVPPIVFDRNAHLVPRLVRVADILWAGAGLSGHYRTSSICPPTSVYSLPLCLIDLAGGWDAGDTAIGEDLHMYIKCFFALNGNLTTRSVFSPASHTNVHSSGNGIRGFFEDLNARYKQAMRHMWGALDSGFVLKSITQLWRAKRVNDKGLPCPQPPYVLLIPDRNSIHWTNIFKLLHRMFEAHFLPIHLTLLLLFSGLYTLFTPEAQIPRLLLQTLNLTGYVRLLILPRTLCLFATSRNVSYWTFEPVLLLPQLEKDWVRFLSISGGWSTVWESTSKYSARLPVLDNEAGI